MSSCSFSSTSSVDSEAELMFGFDAISSGSSPSDGRKRFQHTGRPRSALAAAGSSLVRAEEGEMRSQKVDSRRFRSIRGVAQQRLMQRLSEEEAERPLAGLEAFEAAHSKDESSLPSRAAFIRSDEEAMVQDIIKEIMEA